MDTEARSIILILVLLVTTCLVAVIAIADNKILNEKNCDDKVDYAATYTKYKEKAKSIKGTVIDTQVYQSEGNRLLTYIEHYLVVKSHDDKVLIQVSKDQYINYVKGEKVNFRYDPSNDNRVILDVAKHGEVSDKEDMKKKVNAGEIDKYFTIDKNKGVSIENLNKE
ncbi:hypothetical protein [Staphylococcus hyicus]|uniref:hypothetical protein n=1 Tax=Staphylococcus hyicus TaxID=1284 RepID=UPI003132D2FA